MCSSRSSVRRHMIEVYSAFSDRWNSYFNWDKSTNTIRMSHMYIFVLQLALGEKSVVFPNVLTTNTIPRNASNVD